MFSFRKLWLVGLAAFSMQSAHAFVMCGDEIIADNGARTSFSSLISTQHQFKIMRNLLIAGLAVWAGVFIYNQWIKNHESASANATENK